MPGVSSWQGKLWGSAAAAVEAARQVSPGGQTESSAIPVPEVAPGSIEILSAVSEPAVMR